MKKLIFAVLSLGILFTNNASADGFCQNWEDGQIIISTFAHIKA